MATEAYKPFTTVLDSGNMLHVFGDLDLMQASKFAAAIEEAAAGGNPVFVNLTECSYLDCSALLMLVRAMKRFGTQIRLVIGAKSQVRRVIELTNLNTLIPTSYVERTTDGEY